MLRLFSAAARRLPPSIASRLGCLVGWLLWHVVRLRRRVAVGNIAHSLEVAPSLAQGIGRSVYAHLGRVLVDFARVGALDAVQARQMLGEANLGRLADLRRSGRGVLVLSAHLGNWDLLACCAGLCGLPVTVVTREISSRTVNRHWMRERQRCGVQLVGARGSAGAVVRALKNNEIVAIVLDQHEPGGLAVPFFGRPAATSTTLARLAAATGAPVAPVFMVRDGGGYRAHMLDAVRHHRSNDRASDIRSNTEQYTRIIEQQIRRYPDQWFWVHRRWKLPLPQPGWTLPQSG